MLKRINTSEVEERYKKASRELTAFKKHITEAIGEYESSWYYRWYLDGNEIDSKNLTDYHPRVKNVTELKAIIDNSTQAAQLADDLFEYVDGSNDHFSWAWFSPLRDYVRYAVEDYSYSDLRSYDADMKLKVDGDEYQGRPTDVLQKALESNEEFQVGSTFEKKATDALSYHNLTIRLAKTNKEKNELQQKVQEQETIIQNQESLIQTLRDIISELLIQIATFKEVAHSIVGAFGDILAQIGEYFNLISDRESLNQESDSSAGLSTPVRQGKSWQTALPLWLNENGTNHLNHYEEARENLDYAIYNAEGSTSVLNDTSVYNPDMTFEYLDYRQGMEEALTEQVEQKDETAQRNQELELENEQLRRELEQAKQQLVQQNISSSASDADTMNVGQAGPPPPPPPTAPPPPPVKIDTTAGTRFFGKKKDGTDPGLPKPNIAGEPVTPIVSATAPTDVATDFKDELNSRVRTMLQKTGVKYTPEKKVFVASTNSLLFAGLGTRYRAIYAKSPRKSPSQTTPPTPDDNNASNTSLDQTF